MAQNIQFGDAFVTGADDKRAIVEVLCRRIFKADFNSGRLPRDPQIDDMKQMYRETAVDTFVTEEEWEEICQTIFAWQDEDDTRDEPALQKILKRFRRFPTIDKVRTSLGNDRAEQYRASLEHIEDAAIEFPNERYSSPWRKFDLDAAVSIVCDVLAPNANDEQAMSEALANVLSELRARRRERTVMDKASLTRRKAVARSMGIWFPIAKDLHKWRADARTREHMPQLELLMEEVVKRMRLVRSYLQYIPRRRLSARACVDLPMNIERMKAYLRGFIKATKTK